MVQEESSFCLFLTGNLKMSFFSHPTAVIEEGSDIGEGVRIWHFAHIMPRCTIGGDCVIGQNVFIAAGVVLGKNVHVQNNVSLYEGVTCEDDVFLGPSIAFTNIKNPRSAVSRKAEFQKTVVRKGATIGANATIICGTEIGQYAFVGAGAVLTKSIPPYALVIGNPARQVGWVSEYGCRLTFDKSNHAVCEESGETYLLKDNLVFKSSVAADV